MRLALYQPEIPQNMGSMLRTSACLSFGIDIIFPCGFPLGSRELKRVSMDYGDKVSYALHDDFEVFKKSLNPSQRLILLTTKVSNPYYAFSFSENDVLLMGQESAGVPLEVREQVDVSLNIPTAAGCRSLNVAVAAAMVMGEMRRQHPLSA